MIFGTGIDTVEILRIAHFLNRHQRITHVFGERESVWLLKKNSTASYAANFCAKEAFSKAIGTGIRDFSWAEVELLREENGRPYLFLSGRAAKKASDLQLTFHVSVTHDRTYATVVVIAEKRGG